MCINTNPNPNVNANSNPNLTFGFIIIFEEVQRNIQTWHQVTGVFFKAIMHCVCNEWLVSWYHCNFQVINCRMIYNLLTLLAFIWLRCETALAPGKLTYQRSLATARMHDCGRMVLHFPREVLFPEVK